MSQMLSVQAFLIPLLFDSVPRKHYIYLYIFVVGPLIFPELLLLFQRTIDAWQSVIEFVNKHRFATYKFARGDFAYYVVRYWLVKEMADAKIHWVTTTLCDGRLEFERALDYDTYRVTMPGYQHITIELERGTPIENGQSDKVQIISIRAPIGRQEDIEKFVQAVYEAESKNRPDDVLVFESEENGKMGRIWAQPKYRRAPDWEDWIQPLDLKRDIDAVVEDFRNPQKRAMREKVKAPIHLGILCYGRHRSGKTQGAIALARRLKMPLYIMPLSQDNIHNSVLQDLLQTTAKNSLVLWDECDIIPPDKEKKIQFRSWNNLSQTGVQRLVEAWGENKGGISYFTTNKRNQLWKSLLVPGRVDHQFLFRRANREQVAGLFYLYCYKAALTEQERDEEKLGDKKIGDLSNEFAEKVPEDTYYPGEIVQYLLSHLGNPKEALDGIGDFTKTPPYINREAEEILDRHPEIEPSDSESDRASHTRSRRRGRR